MKLPDMRTFFEWAGVAVIALVLAWSSATDLLGDGVPAAPELSARVIALVVVATSYGLALAGVMYVVKRLASWLRPLFSLVLVVFLTVPVSVVVPFGCLVPLRLTYGICTHESFPCAEPPFLSHVPHALYVACTYPVQVLFVWPAVLAWLWFVRRGALRKQPRKDSAV